MKVQELSSLRLDGSRRRKAKSDPFKQNAVLRLLEVKELSSLRFPKAEPLAVWQRHRDEVAQRTHNKRTQFAHQPQSGFIARRAKEQEKQI